MSKMRALTVIHSTFMFSLSLSLSFFIRICIWCSLFGSFHLRQPLERNIQRGTILKKCAHKLPAVMLVIIPIYMHSLMNECICVWLKPVSVGVIFQIQQNFNHLTFAVKNETKEWPVAQGFFLKKDDFLLWFLSTLLNLYVERLMAIEYGC